MNEKMNEKAVTNRPIAYGWLPYGKGRGIKWTLWQSNVTLQRQEKEGDNWQIKEELHIAPILMKELLWRVPNWLVLMENNRKEVK